MIDRDVDRAPWVPLYNPRTVTALAARVGNHEYHPFWNVLLDQLLGALTASAGRSIPGSAVRLFTMAVSTGEETR